MPSESNKRLSCELATHASAARIWALWMDVARWGEWDLGLKSAELSQPMALGATGWIIDNRRRRSRFRVTEFDLNRSYAFVTKLPLGSLVVRRTILQDRPCRFRHDVHFEGIGGQLLSHLLGPSFRSQLPPTLQKLSDLAEADPEG